MAKNNLKIARLKVASEDVAWGGGIRNPRKQETSIC